MTKCPTTNRIHLQCYTISTFEKNQTSNHRIDSNSQTHDFSLMLPVIDGCWKSLRMVSGPHTLTKYLSSLHSVYPRINSFKSLRRRVSVINSIFHRHELRPAITKPKFEVHTKKCLMNQPSLLFFQRASHTHPST